MSEFERQQDQTRNSSTISSAKSEQTLRTEHPAQKDAWGNQAAQRFAQSCPLRLPSPGACSYGGACHACPAPMQAKLQVNEPGDEYEQEADRVANQVMRMPEPRVQRQVEPAENEEEELVQTKQVGGQTPQVDPKLATQIRSLKGGGQPLPPSTRSFFEPRFGRDFSQVRVHTGPQASRAAKALNARSFAAGHDLAFGAEQYAPGTTEGRKLLAHELTHVVQQDRGICTRTNRQVAANGSPSITIQETDSTLQRSVAVALSAAQLRVASKPSVGLEIKKLLGKWRVLPVTPKNIEFRGRAMVTCGQGESAAGYEVGILQIETREVNNALYTGVNGSDGWVWVRRDIPAVRPPGPCIDSSRRGRRALFWSVSKPASCGRMISLTHWDFPQDMYKTIIKNPITKKPNYLRKIQLASDFITALMFKHPDKRLQALRWVTWNLSWDYFFDTPKNGKSKVERGTAQWGILESATSGAVPLELPKFYSLPAKSCNDLVFEANRNPARIKAGKTW